VTAKAQPGNPRPRSFRLVEDRALINRMGVNNHGAQALAKQLARARRSEPGQHAVSGVHIGTSKVTAPAEDAADDRFSASPPPPCMTRTCKPWPGSPPRPGWPA